MTAKTKGFNRNRQKAPTKADIVKNLSPQVQDNHNQLEALKQFINQSSQQFAAHLQQLQRQVDELSVLARLVQAPGPSKINDRIIIDLMAREVTTEGVSETYVPELTTMGTSLLLEADTTFFPELVNALTGVTVGSEVSAQATIPETYPVESLRGKTVAFKANVVNIYSPTDIDTKMSEIKSDLDKQLLSKDVKVTGE